MHDRHERSGALEYERATWRTLDDEGLALLMHGLVGALLSYRLSGRTCCELEVLDLSLYLVSYYVDGPHTVPCMRVLHFA